MIIRPTSIPGIFSVIALSLFLTQAVSASRPEPCTDTPASLTIAHTGYTQNGSLFNPTLSMEIESSSQFPDDEKVLMLRVYRQIEQAPLEKQDIYLTASAEGINRTMHTSPAVWKDELTLNPTVGGTRHYYTFSIVTNRKEYFSNTVESKLPAVPGTQHKSEGDIHTLPVVFHLFEHKGLPQTHFDAGTAREWIAAANAVLGNAASTDGLVDTHVRLEVAEKAPDGTPLAEPGIHRSSDTPVLCLDGRVGMLDLEHQDLYWDQDAYLNVVILPFAMTDNIVLGQYPQFPEGYILSGCQTMERPTMPHAVYVNSMAEPVHGIPFFLLGLGYYLGLTDEHGGGVYGLNPSKNTHLGCTVSQAERIGYTLKHAWNTARPTK